MTSEEKISWAKTVGLLQQWLECLQTRQRLFETSIAKSKAMGFPTEVPEEWLKEVVAEIAAMEAQLTREADNDDVAH